jgi:hypothetical protein
MTTEIICTNPSMSGVSKPVIRIQAQAQRRDHSSSIRTAVTEVTH